jgi:hypothetical protein
VRKLLEIVLTPPASTAANRTLFYYFPSIYRAVIADTPKFKEQQLSASPHGFPYFDVVLGLVWSCDPESYASSFIATGRVTHAGQVKDDDPDKRDTLVLQIPGGHWVATPLCKKP